MLKKSHLLDLLTKHETGFLEEKMFRQQAEDFLRRNDEFWQRTTLEGHITGSAWVLSPDGESVLLIHHKKLDRWLQPGGHADEADVSVADTAVRELREETGLADVVLGSPNLFDVDVHEIPQRGLEPVHLHYDLRFAFRAASLDFEANILEVKNVRWVPLAELVGAETEPSIRRMALKSFVIGNRRI